MINNFIYFLAFLGALLLSILFYFSYVIYAGCMVSNKKYNERRYDIAKARAENYVEDMINTPYPNRPFTREELVTMVYNFAVRYYL